MGLLYLYLVAWIVGGVLLGARMLLTHRDPAPPVSAMGSVPQSHPPASSPLAIILAAAALIGFGMFGLLAEGLGLVAGGWTVGCAALGSLVFAAVAQLLRTRL